MQERDPTSGVLTRRNFIATASHSMAGLTALAAGGRARRAGTEGKLGTPPPNPSVGDISALDINTAYRPEPVIGPRVSRAYGVLRDAAWSTGLDQVARRALARAILVVSFDTVVSAPGGLPVNVGEVQLRPRPGRLAWVCAFSRA